MKCATFLVKCTFYPDQCTRYYTLYIHFKYIVQEEQSLVLLQLYYKQQSQTIQTRMHIFKGQNVYNRLQHNGNTNILKITGE